MARKSQGKPLDKSPSIPALAFRLRLQSVERDAACVVERFERVACRLIGDLVGVCAPPLFVVGCLQSTTAPHADAGDVRLAPW
jgi:hypothetical protein